MEPETPSFSPDCLLWADFSELHLLLITGGTYRIYLDLTVDEKKCHFDLQSCIQMEKIKLCLRKHFPMTCPVKGKKYSSDAQQSNIWPLMHPQATAWRTHDKLLEDLAAIVESECPASLTYWHIEHLPDHSRHILYSICIGFILLNK